jgi:hypothetical protein
MNVLHGGKQGVFRPAQILQDFEYPPDFPLTKLRKNMFQEMVFREGDPPPFYKPNLQPDKYVNKPKGMRQVAFERGLWREGMTENGANGNADDNTSLKFVLSECLDFKQQKSALAEAIERAGHLCEFSPKYHCEVQPIERCWSVSKRFMRGSCQFDYDAMKRKIVQSLLDPAILPVAMIRRFFRKSRDYMRAYHSGLMNFRDVNAAVKHYKSHRKTLGSEAAEKKFKPYEKKKEMLKKKFDECFLAKDIEMPILASTPSSGFNYDTFVADFAEAFRLLDEENDYDSDFNVNFEN